jgi:hypothetical protein
MMYGHPGPDYLPKWVARAPMSPTVKAFLHTNLGIRVGLGAVPSLVPTQAALLLFDEAKKRRL